MPNSGAKMHAAGAQPSREPVLKVDPRDHGRHWPRKLLRSVWLAGIAAVVVGSLLPGDSPLIRGLDALNISDKIQHFAAYAALAFLPALHERRRAAALLALALVGLGILLELGQLFSPARMFEMGDLVADTGGVSIGLAVGWLIRTHSAFSLLLEQPKVNRDKGEDIRPE